MSTNKVSTKIAANTKQMSDVLMKLFGHKLRDRLLGRTDECFGPTSLLGSVIDHHMTRMRVCRDLVTEGYLRVLADDAYAITDKVLDETPEIKPQLSAYLSRPLHETVESFASGNKPWGVLFHTLPDTERKYIVNHPEEYRLAYVNENHAYRFVPVTVGSDAHTRHLIGYREELYVCDDALGDLIAEHVRVWRINNLFNRNVSYALEKYAGVATNEAALWQVGGEDFPLFGHPRTTRVLGSDSNEWAQKAQEALAKAREQVIEAARNLASCEEALSRVAAYGGWDALARQLREDCARSVDRT